MRPAVVIVCVAAVLAAAGVLGHARPSSDGATIDFSQYKAAAEVIARGGDMYDPRELLAVQVPAGLTGVRPQPGITKTTPDAMMMWLPPWVTPLILPLTFLSWGGGLWAWVAAQVLAYAASAYLLIGRDHPLPTRVVLFVALMIFPPLAYDIALGQVPALILLGVAGFVHGVRSGRPLLAGAALALTAVKPHLLLVFAVVVALDALNRPATRRAVAVGSLLLLAGSLSAVALRPTIWGDYFAATAAPTDEYHVAPADWDAPILARDLARLTGGSWAVQFLPTAVACVVWAVLYWRGRADWDWAGRAPALVLTCLLTTGYGAWLFDLVLLAVPLAWAGNRLARRGGRVALYSFGVYLVGCVAIFLSPVPVSAVTPAVAVFTLAAWLLTRQSAADPAAR